MTLYFLAARRLHRGRRIGGHEQQRPRGDRPAARHNPASATTTTAGCREVLGHGDGSVLLRRGLPAFATSGLVLGSRTALVALARSGMRLLAAMLGRLRRVRDLGRPFLRHPLVLQGFVLLLVLHVGRLAGHGGSPPPPPPRCCTNRCPARVLVTPTATCRRREGPSTLAL